MHPESIFSSAYDFRSVLVAADDALLWGDRARQFATKAATEMTTRAAAHFDCPTHSITTLDAETLVTSAHAAGVRQITTPYAPIGPVADALADLTLVLAQQGITLVTIRREWDSRFWPHAKRGFFNFKERMPALLSESGL